MGGEKNTHFASESSVTNRRRLLQRTGATVASVTGLAAANGTVSAQSSDGVEEFNLDGLGAADELPSSNESELVIYLHGGGASSTADEQGQSLEDGLADAGYDTTVVAGVFSTTSVGIGDETSDAAETLAELIEDYDETTGGTIRLVGYSLGGILTMQTLNALDDDITLETVASLGTGAPGSTVCEDEEYDDGIANNTDEFRVLVSEDDDAVQLMGAMEPDCGGLFGGGSPPGTLTMVDVTDDVDDHLVYLESDVVMADLADSFDGDGGTDDGDDNGYGWFDAA